MPLRPRRSNVKSFGNFTLYFTLNFQEIRISLSTFLASKTLVLAHRLQSFATVWADWIAVNDLWCEFQQLKFFQIYRRWPIL